MDDSQAVGVYNDTVESTNLSKQKYVPPMLIILDALNIASGSQGIFESDGGAGPLNS